MGKKFFACFLVLFLITGCGVNSSKPKKNVVKGEITCTADGSNFNLLLEDGQIVKYIDSIDGELGQETVDILNQEHLVGVTDNDTALSIMDNALKDLDGHCEKVSSEE